MSDAPVTDEWMISVDDHLIEPPSVWVDRLPAKHRDAGPRWVSDERGEAWLLEGSRRIPVSGAVTAGAFWPPEERPGPFTPMPWSDVPPSCYDPMARAEAMDRDRVLASLVFPNLPGFAGGTFVDMDDKDLALLCVQAYNDWLLDEFAAAIPGRVIGAAILPLWDGDLCAAEAARAIAKGARAVSFSMAPPNLGLPPIHDESWDALYAVMDEAGLPICTHLGTGFGGAAADVRARQPDLANLPGAKSGEADMGAINDAMVGGDFGKIMAMLGGADQGSGTRRPRPAGGVLLQLAGQTTLVEWINSGNFERFPNLKLALSENGIGWIPAVLQVADWMQEMSATRITSPFDPENEAQPTEQGRALAAASIEARAQAAERARTPSEVFREHVYGCFIHDPVGFKLLDELGVDNVMIETDFPHNSTWWPHSMDKAQEWSVGLDADVRRKILRGNAERLFAFTPAEPPVAAAAG